MQSFSVFARISRLAANLRIATMALEAGIVLCTLLGVGAGFAVALHSTESSVAGIAIVISALLCGLFYWCVARAMHLFAEDVAVSHKVDLAHRREAFYNADERRYAITTSVETTSTPEAN